MAQINSTTLSMVHDKAFVKKLATLDSLENNLEGENSQTSSLRPTEVAIVVIFLATLKCHGISFLKNDEDKLLADSCKSCEILLLLFPWRMKMIGRLHSL